MSLTPEEEAEFQELQRTFGEQAHGLTPDEEAEFLSLQQEFGTPEPKPEEEDEGILGTVMSGIEAFNDFSASTRKSLTGGLSDDLEAYFSPETETGDDIARKRNERSPLATDIGEGVGYLVPGTPAGKFAGKAIGFGVGAAKEGVVSGLKKVSEEGVTKALAKGIGKMSLPDFLGAIATGGKSAASKIAKTLLVKKGKDTVESSAMKQAKKVMEQRLKAFNNLSPKERSAYMKKLKARGVQK
jgi:hypothetical protein